MEKKKAEISLRYFPKPVRIDNTDLLDKSLDEPNRIRLVHCRAGQHQSLLLLLGSHNIGGRQRRGSKSGHRAAYRSTTSISIRLVMLLSGHMWSKLLLLVMIRLRRDLLLLLLLNSILVVIVLQMLLGQWRGRWRRRRR